MDLDANSFVALAAVAWAAAFDVSCAPGGHRPHKYDFPALVKTLRERLPTLEG